MRYFVSAIVVGLAITLTSCRSASPDSVSPMPDEAFIKAYVEYEYEREWDPEAQEAMRKGDVGQAKEVLLKILRRICKKYGTTEAAFRAANHLAANPPDPHWYNVQLQVNLLNAKGPWVGLYGHHTDDEWEEFWIRNPIKLENPK